MNKPKRQSKVIFSAPKRDKKYTFSLLVSPFHLFLGVYILFVLFGFNTFLTHAFNPTTPVTPSKMPLLTQNFVLSAETASPSVQIDFPTVAEFEKSFEPKEATQPAQIAEEKADYCVDLPVVMYHHIQPLQLATLLGHAPLTVDAAIFDQQMKYLKDNGYVAISTEDLISALYNRDKLPEKSVMITIDDGYDDNYTYAFMTAKKYEMVMNFMIPTGLIEKPGYMTWDHLVEMSKNPFAKLYNHTTSHAALGALGKEGIMYEVDNANKEFETRLGIKNTIITYPYGSYSDLAIETLKEMGMRGAITTEPGRMQCLSSIMRLPRMRIANGPMESYGF